SIDRILLAKRTRRSISTQFSRSVLRRLSDNAAMPFLISPSVSTLRKSISSGAVSTHAITRGSGFGLTSSDIQFVSRRNPVTGLLVFLGLGRVPDVVQCQPAVIRGRTGPGSWVSVLEQ